MGGPWVDYDYADTVPGRAKAEAEYLANHGRMNSLRNCYVQFREAIRRGTTHVRGHIDVGVFGLAELEDAGDASPFPAHAPKTPPTAYRKTPRPPSPNNSRLPHGRNSRRTASPALPLPSPTYKKGQARKPAL